jgi:threonyl-tRNA synthetase
MQEKYWEYEYDEVVTPNIYNLDLWRTSGHADHYKDNMFFIDIEKAQFGLKPMNCPGHCLMFAHRKRSYKELPMRYADFGVLHRNEFSGALHGLTRVRRFQQDDAHIFCMPHQVCTHMPAPPLRTLRVHAHGATHAPLLHRRSGALRRARSACMRCMRVAQVKDEISSFLKMLGEVYAVFGLDYTLALSTRPEGYIGQVELWNQAEKALEESLNESGAAQLPLWPQVAPRCECRPARRKRGSSNAGQRASHLAGALRLRRPSRSRERLGACTRRMRVRPWSCGCAGQRGVVSA